MSKTIYMMVQFQWSLQKLSVGVMHGRVLLKLIIIIQRIVFASDHCGSLRSSDSRYSSHRSELSIISDRQKTHPTESLQKWSERLGWWSIKFREFRGLSWIEVRSWNSRFFFLSIWSRWWPVCVSLMLCKWTNPTIALVGCGLWICRTLPGIRRPKFSCPKFSCSKFSCPKFSLYIDTSWDRRVCVFDSSTSHLIDELSDCPPQKSSDEQR